MKIKLYILFGALLVISVLIGFQFTSILPPEVLNHASKNDPIVLLRSRLKDSDFIRLNNDGDTWVKKRIIGKWVVEIDSYQDASLSGVLNFRSEYRHPWFKFLNRSRNHN
jgi:hypothetical protein